MPIPRSETKRRQVIQSAITRRPTRFKSGSSSSLARELIAKKILRRNPTVDKSGAYAIATFVIKRGRGVRSDTQRKAMFAHMRSKQ